MDANELKRRRGKLGNVHVCGTAPMLVFAGWVEIWERTRGEHLTAHCKLTKNVEGGVGKMPLAAAAAAMQH